MEPIKIDIVILASVHKVWDYFNLPEHIVNWNFANEDWHCPKATNDLRVGGRLESRMEAKDGSFGFDFEAIYTEINVGKSFIYEFGGRTANVSFQKQNNQTEIIVEFDPENENPIEMQKTGWQSILNNFKKYLENN